MTEQISPACDEDYNRLLNECVGEVDDRNQQLVERYGFGSYDRWDIDQTVGELIFSDAGVTKLACSISILGSYSAVSGTWMWGWANPSLLEPLTRDTLAVRNYGEQNQIQDLVVEKTPTTDGEAWALSALACRILNGLGLYRGPTGNGFVVMLIKGIQQSE